MGRSSDAALPPPVTMLRTLSARLKTVAGYGRLRSQWLYEKLYFHGIYGQNYASPNHTQNGEVVAVTTVADHLLRQHGAGPLMVFDVGANVGEYARVLRGAFGERAVLHCFEPSPVTFARLLADVGGEPQTHLHQMGLGDKPGEFTLYFNSDLTTVSSLYDLPDGHQWKGSESQVVQVETLDGFVDRHGIGRIHFLKIDTEGFELPVLQGGARLLAAEAIDFIQFEFGFRQIDSRHFFRDFWSLLHDRYHLFRIVQDGLVPIRAYHESLEVFVGVSNYIAQRKGFGPALLR